MNTAAFEIKIVSIRAPREIRSVVLVRVSFFRIAFLPSRG
jgi:hypothetical protein